MIKFDKVTLEPKFIDPSMCFCGGGGGTGGGGTPTKGTNAINRGTVGMTAAEMNRRADAQERGSREVANLSAGISDNISPGAYGRSDPKGEVAGGFGDDEDSDSFITTTEAAYRDLNRRAMRGQIPNLSKGFDTPIGRIPTPTSAVFNVVNKFGMNRAQDIRDQIRGGGVPVTDRYGRIQGVVSEGTGPIADILGAFGQSKNVYTGSPSFAPSASQLGSYRPDPTRQGIASLPYADVQMPTTTRAQPLSMQSAISSSLNALPQYDVNVPSYLSNYDLDAKKAAIEAMIRDNKGAIPADLVQGGYLPASTSGIQRSSQPRGNLTPTELETLQNTSLSPQLGTINDPTATAFNIGRGPMTEDPRAVAEREQVLDRVRAAASGEAFPEDRNMYGPGMQDFGPMTPDQLETYQDSYLSPQYGTINDPTAQAGVFDGIGEFFTETIPGVFDYSTPAKAKSSKSKAQSNADRFKGTNVRTKPVGPVEYFTNLFG